MNYCFVELALSTVASLILYYELLLY